MQCSETILHRIVLCCIIFLHTLLYLSEFNICIVLYCIVKLKY